jgi:hypothetical protein
MCDGGCAVVVRTLLLRREALLLLTASCSDSQTLPFSTWSCASTTVCTSSLSRR